MQRTKQGRGQKVDEWRGRRREPSLNFKAGVFIEHSSSSVTSFNASLSTKVKVDIVRLK